MFESEMSERLSQPGVATGKCIHHKHEQKSGWSIDIEKEIALTGHSYIPRVVLVIIMEFHWLIGRVL